MSDRGRGTALGDLASDLAAEGTSVSPTGGRVGNSGGDGGTADLFRALDGEIADFEGATISPPRKRGPGRPPGSVNRTTLQLQRFLTARGYRDPAEFLASIVSMDTRELAASLKGKPVETVGFDEAAEAFKIQKGAAAELMPYWHQRKPLQVEHVGEGARPLIIINDGAAGGVRVGGSDGAMSVFDVVENQLLSHAAGGKSHDDKSHDEG